MSITLADVLSDPTLFLFEYDATSAHFLRMGREDYRRSIFLDGRIKHAGAQPVRVPLPQLLAGYQQSAPPRQRIGWIFHVAQCGSTLIARALDHPGRSLVLREPAALRRLALEAGAGGTLPADREPMLPMLRDLAGKRWDASQPLVIKANVPVNFIAADLMRLDPEAPALLLYFPLVNYAAAILRTPGHVDWTERVFGELRLGESQWCRDAQPRDAAEKAGALWFAQMALYHALLKDMPNVHSLHAAEIFDNAEATIAASAGLFGVPLAEGEAAALAQGELYHSYSKNPTLDYDPEVRLAREAEAIARLQPETERARAWALSAKERFGLPDALARPLVGNAPMLL